MSLVRVTTPTASGAERPDVEGLRLRSRVNELFRQSRSAAGSRSIVSMMQEDGEQIGRFKVRGLVFTDPMPPGS